MILSFFSRYDDQRHRLERPLDVLMTAGEGERLSLPVRQHPRFFLRGEPSRRTGGRVRRRGTEPGPEGRSASRSRATGRKGVCHDHVVARARHSCPLKGRNNSSAVAVTKMKVQSRCVMHSSASMKANRASPGCKKLSKSNNIIPAVGWRSKHNPTHRGNTKRCCWRARQLDMDSIVEACCAVRRPSAGSDWAACWASSHARPSPATPM